MINKLSMSSGTAKPTLKGKAKMPNGKTKIESSAPMPQTKPNRLKKVSCAPLDMKINPAGVSKKYPPAKIPCKTIESTVNIPTNPRQILLINKQITPK